MATVTTIDKRLAAIEEDLKKIKQILTGMGKDVLTQKTVLDATVNTVSDLAKAVVKPAGFYPVVVNKNLNIFPVGNQTPVANVEAAVAVAQKYIESKGLENHCWASALAIW